MRVVVSENSSLVCIFLLGKVCGCFRVSWVALWPFCPSGTGYHFLRARGEREFLRKVTRTHTRMQTHPLTGSEVRDQCLGCLLALCSRVSLTDAQKHAVLEDSEGESSCERRQVYQSQWLHIFLEKWCLWLSKINHYSLWDQSGQVSYKDPELAQQRPQ